MKDAVVAGRILMSKADGGGYYAVDCAGTDFTFSVIGRGNDEAVYGKRLLMSWLVRLWSL